MQAVTSGEKLTSVFRKTSSKIQGNAERGRPEGGKILGSKTQVKLSRMSLVFCLHTLNETEQINIIFSPSLFISNSYKFCSQNQADDLLHFIH